MKNCVIIGIGNTLRGDDALGWIAAERLEFLEADNLAEVLTVQQLSLDLVEPISQTRLVIFIDAKMGAPVGEFNLEKIEPDSALSNQVTHFFDPQTLLAAIQALYGRHPEAYLASIKASKFAFGASLSPEISAALPTLLESIEQIVISAQRTN